MKYHGARNNKRFSLSLKDVKILLPIVDFCISLDEGYREPTTLAQKHFILVCRGKAHPVSDYEKAYIKWRVAKPNLQVLLDKSEKSARYVRSLDASQSNLSDTTLQILGKQKRRGSLVSNFSKDDLIRAEKARQKRASKGQNLDTKSEDFKKRKVVETWGSRDAWRKDSARNKFNGS